MIAFAPPAVQCHHRCIPSRPRPCRAVAHLCVQMHASIRGAGKTRRLESCSWMCLHKKVTVSMHVWSEHIQGSIVASRALRRSSGFLTIVQHHFRRRQRIACSFALPCLDQVCIQIDSICLVMNFGCFLSARYGALFLCPFSGAQSRANQMEVYCRVPYVWFWILILK